MHLSDLADADRRATDARVRDLAGRIRAPHPLANVEYADGTIRCTHARKHRTRWEPCNSAELAIHPPAYRIAALCDADRRTTDDHTHTLASLTLTGDLIDTQDLT